MHELVTIILASHADSRMSSSASVVTHRVCGKLLLSYVIDAADQAGSDSLTVVLDEQSGYPREIAPQNTVFIECKIQNDSIQTLMKIQNFLKNKEGPVFFIEGNITAVTSQTLQSAFDCHLKQNHDVTFLTTQSEKVSKGNAIHSSNCFININSLLKQISMQDNRNIAKQNTISEIIQKMTMDGKKIIANKVLDPAEPMAVHDRFQLYEAECVIFKEDYQGTHTKRGHFSSA